MKGVIRRLILARQRGRAQRGVALTEFAIVFPLVMAVTLGIIQLGFLLNTYVSLTNTAREGARSAISYRNMSGGDAARRTAAQSAIYNTLDPTLPSPTGLGLNVGHLYPWNDSDVQFASATPVPTNPIRSGEPVTVTVRYRYDLSFGLLPQLPPMDLTARSRMIIE